MADMGTNFAVPNGPARLMSSATRQSRAAYCCAPRTFSRIEVTSQPRSRRRFTRAGVNCLSFAAAALLSTSRHQDDPSMGPGLTVPRSERGINDSIAASRSPDSLANWARRASVGESSAACCRETG